MRNALVTWLTLTTTSAAHASPASFVTLNGRCTGASHTSTGPTDDSRPAPKIPYGCDIAIVVRLTDHSGRTLIQFSDGRSDDVPIRGYSGIRSGDIVKVKTYYPVPGRALSVDAGTCRFFHESRAVEIMCVAEIKRAGVRTVSEVAFRDGHALALQVARR